MASIKERIETVFAALAFAERDLRLEALQLVEGDGKGVGTAPVKRADNRPRVRA